MNDDIHKKAPLREEVKSTGWIQCHDGQLDELSITGRLDVHMERIDDSHFHFSVVEDLGDLQFKTLFSATMCSRRIKGKQALIVNQMGGCLTDGWTAD